ncbi:MAG: cupin domain-containing protein [Nitrososphaera sp.]|jgi:mannose-6-phosphate isomerase-like protein (cupin superfamily)
MKKNQDAKVFDLHELELYFDRNPGEYFFDFLRLGHLEAGIIKLAPGAKDTQTAHDLDELYYVIRGSGMLKLGSAEVPVRDGSIIFVPKGMTHEFFGNNELLVVLYVFPTK